MSLDLTEGEKIGSMGSAVVFVAALLPWASFGPVSETGVRGDGIFTLLISIGTISLIIFRDWDVKSSLLIMAAGLSSLMIGAYDINNVSRLTSAFTNQVDVRMGVYITIFGGLLLTFAGLYDLYFTGIEEE